MCEEIGHPRARARARRLRPAHPRRPEQRRPQAPVRGRGRAPALAPALTESPAMALFALRGATSVESNDSAQILAATTELMQELMARNSLTPDAGAELHLHRDRRPRRRVPGRRGARDRLRGRRAAVRPGDPGARLAAAGHPRPDALPGPRRAHTRRPSTSARRARCAATFRRLGRRAGRRPGTITRWRSSSQSASGASPCIPRRAATPQDAPLVSLASNESPFAPIQAVRDAIAAQLGSLNRYPDPSSTLLRRRLSERYEVPASRIAIGNGSCDILLAAGEALLEPGRGGRVRVAVVLGLSAPGGGVGRPRGDGPARRVTSATTCPRCSRRSPSRRGW